MNPLAPPTNLALNPLQRLERDSHLSKEDQVKLKSVSKQFEAVLMNQMVGAMRKTVSKGGLIPESQAEKVYQSMLDSEHAERLADSEQLGLSRLVYEHLLRISSMR